jgi:hypothetical protein
MFVFLDSTLSKVRRRQARGNAANDDVLEAAGTVEWSKRKMLLRFLTRITYISITTLLGAMLPFFGDFLELWWSFDYLSSQLCLGAPHVHEGKVY